MKTKFKVGERVRILKAHLYLGILHAGTSGTVTSIQPDGIEVKCDANGRSITFAPGEIVSAPQPATPENYVVLTATNGNPYGIDYDASIYDGGVNSRTVILRNSRLDQEIVAEARGEVAASCRDDGNGVHVFLEGQTIHLDYMRLHELRTLLFLLDRTAGEKTKFALLKEVPK